MVSPGVLPAHVLAQLRAAGADFYAVYQETHDSELFSRLRLGQDFEERVQARRDGHAAGLLVEDGLLSGVGDGPADRASSVQAMREAGDQQVRAMTLVPQEQTPLSGVPTPATWNEVLTIAVMRLLMPDRLIPASLDVEGIEGLRSRLDAGANVVTSLVPPRSAASAAWPTPTMRLTTGCVRRPKSALGSPSLACGRERKTSSRLGWGPRARSGAANIEIDRKWEGRPRPAPDRPRRARRGWTGW